MKRILILVGGFAGLVALAWVAGSLLPRDHRAASSITLSQPPEAVWLVVRDLAALKGTWPELTEAVMSADSVGREIWHEKVDGFDMRLLVTESVPLSRFVTLIQSPPGASFGGRWIYQLDPAGSGTRVTVTEEGWVANPFFRLMSKLGGHHRSIDGYLTALGKHFGETVTPEHL